MGRILAIDYGMKRVGIAVTDPLRLIATPLTTIEAADIWRFLKAYIAQEKVDIFVVGMPKRLDNTASPMTASVTKLMKKLQQAFPNQQIVAHDERYTSRLAAAGMIEGGFKKKDRRNKANLDKLSATIILQSFLASTPLE